MERRFTPTCRKCGALKKMQSFRDFLRWFNNKDFATTLEAMQRLLEFYHNKGVLMLKLGCNSSNVANSFLDSSTESDEDLLSKIIRGDMVGGPSKVFTRKTVFDGTNIHSSTIVCKSIVGLDACQPWPYSMCQPMTR